MKFEQPAGDKIEPSWVDGAFGTGLFTQLATKIIGQIVPLCGRAAVSDFKPFEINLSWLVVYKKIILRNLQFFDKKK